MLARTINCFAQALPGAPLVVVLPEEHRRSGATWRPASTWRGAYGRDGRCRTLPLREPGLEALPPDVELIAVHDGVRPPLSAELIRRTVAVAAEYGTAVPAIAPVDSFRSTEGGFAPRGPQHAARRANPQVFRAPAAARRLRKPSSRPDFTDDASVVERFGATIPAVRRRAPQHQDHRPRGPALRRRALLADDADRAAAEAARPGDEAAMSDRTEAGIPAGRDAAAPEAAE